MTRTDEDLAKKLLKPSEEMIRAGIVELEQSALMRRNSAKKYEAYQLVESIFKAMIEEALK